MPFPFYSLAQSELPPSINADSVSRGQKIAKINIFSCQQCAGGKQDEIQEPSKLLNYAQFNGYGFTIYIDSIIHHYNLQLSGKNKIVITGTEQNCAGRET